MKSKIITTLNSPSHAHTEIYRQTDRHMCTGDLFKYDDANKVRDTDKIYTHTHTH